MRVTKPSRSWRSSPWTARSSRSNNVKQLDVQHSVAAEQALKEHAANSTPSLESYVQSQFPPGLEPSPIVQEAIKNLSKQLHEELRSAQSTKEQAQEAASPSQAPRPENGASLAQPDAGGQSPAEAALAAAIEEPVDKPGDSGYIVE